jgi:hypothetical protein
MGVVRMGRSVKVLGLVGFAAVAAACSGAGGEQGTAEKTAAAKDALILGGPTPWMFPDSNAPNNCEYGTDDNGRPIPRSLETFGVFPTTPGATMPDGSKDPYQTTYTHYWRWGLCASNDLACQHTTSLFSIPKAHGFKYLTQQLVTALDPVTKTRTWVTTGHQYLMMGVQRVDESWWYQPWQYQGVAAPWTIIDANSHPPYGSDAMSADWAQLWNVVYTYGDEGPHGNASAGNIVESQLHTCVTLIAMNADGTPPPWPGTRVDYFVAADDFDPAPPPPW